MSGERSREEALRAALRAFEALEIEPTTDRGQITRAFRRLALRWHPDRHPEEEKKQCAARFRALVTARDLCFQASAIPSLMEDLKEFASTENRRVGTQADDAENESTPGRYAPDSHEMRASTQEWKLFVEHPGAYFNLFTLSFSNLLVGVTVGLVSAAVAALGVLVFTVGAIVVAAVSFVLSVLAISIPILGWIALAVAGVAAAAWVWEQVEEGFAKLEAFVGRELARTAFPQKSLLVTWAGANAAAIACAVAVWNETFAAFTAVALIIGNICFNQLNESLGRTLGRIEAEYSAIRRRNTQTALVLRSKDQFGSYFSTES